MVSTAETLLSVTSYSITPSLSATNFGPDNDIFGRSSPTAASLGLTELAGLPSVVPSS